MQVLPHPSNLFIYFSIIFAFWGADNAFYMLGRHSVAQLHLHPDDKSQIVNKV